MPRTASGRFYVPLRTSRKYQFRKKARVTHPKQNLVRLIKNVQLKSCETKRSCNFQEGIVCRHNSTAYVLNMLHTTQGDTQAPGMATSWSNRIGDEIIPKGMLCKFHYLSAVTRPNITGVVYLFQYKAGTTINDANFWRGPMGAGGQMPRLIDQPDTNNIRVLKKYKLQNRTANSYIQATGGQTQRLTGAFFDFYYKFSPKHKVKYDANSFVPKWRDLGLAFVFYDANNTATSDDIGYMSYSSTFYFKDP